MVRRIVGFFCLLACLVIGHLALAQEFSADVVTSRSDAKLTKVYAGKGKVRYEGRGEGSPLGPAAVIFDETQHRYLVLMAERHMYMDAPPFTMIKPLVGQFWHVDGE